MPKITTNTLPHDLPENWTSNNFVSPGGTEVGLTERHGYNYLMRQVNLAQLTIEELVSYLSAVQGNKNILHNWSLIYPIDTKDGYLIPSGVSYYNNEAMTSKVGNTLNLSAPDYVGPNYASFNMSGVTYYVPKTSLVPGYIAGVNGTLCMNRWWLKSYSAAYKSDVQMQATGCLFTLSRQAGDFYQNVANAVGASRFSGLTYTFSVKVESVSGGTVNAYIADGVSEKTVKISAAGTYSVSLQVASGASKFVVGVRNTDTYAASTIKISSAKLEVGTICTMDMDPPVDKAEQMAICIQFDPTTDAYTGFTALTTANILADASITQ